MHFFSLLSFSVPCRNFIATHLANGQCGMCGRLVNHSLYQKYMHAKTKVILGYTCWKFPLFVELMVTTSRDGLLYSLVLIVMDCIVDLQQKGNANSSIVP